jgi:hypothetical protein
MIGIASAPNGRGQTPHRSEPVAAEPVLSQTSTLSGSRSGSALADGGGEYVPKKFLAFFGTCSNSLIVSDSFYRSSSLSLCFLALSHPKNLQLFGIML